MNSEAQAIPILPPTPNVGPSPSHPDAPAVFFDRRPDAALLADKVFSARFTVFYGPEGAGKSDVLQNILVPDLENRHACVIFFQDWQSDNPAAALKARLIDEAAKLGISEPGMGKPSLVDLIRLLMVAEDRQIILILDQFEEFLAAPQDRQESLCRELGTLARTPNLDVHVLLSIREQEKGKHFDDLEPMQTIIPNLLQSTFRLAPAPYVGLRPFMRGEEAIFSGRSQEALMLRDKVLSSRITIFYGPTGVGKSSVLHLLLTPLLEKEGACVIYFDKWRSQGAGPDPTDLLADRLARAAFLTIPESGVHRPSLTDLVRLVQEAGEVQNAKKRTVVLILDQFEEFFLDPSPARLDKLRRELGQLVNTTDLDVRVLLSLREEHLASLEPLRTSILNLFQSTHRLEPLTIFHAWRAIEDPAEHFGVNYDPCLINLLLDDFCQAPMADKTGQPAPEKKKTGPDTPVDLPILQLVCHELWNEIVAREVKKRTTAEPIIISGPLTISKDLYEQGLGGLKGIMEEYMGRVMGRKEITARLMEYLAPSSGYKQAHDVTFLADKLKLPRKEVQDELDRLCGVNVLRTRQYGAGPWLYELCHDKFITIISPWCKAVIQQIELKNLSRKRRLWRMAGVAVLMGLAMFAGAVLFAWDKSDLDSNTKNFMKKPEISLDQRFTYVASYLLWTRRGFHPCDLRKNRLDRLRDLLIDHESELPPNYAIDTSGIESIILPGANEKWPLTLEYSSSRNDLNEFFEYFFTLTWQRQAKSMQKDWGIPLPTRLRLKPVDTCEDKDELTLTGEHIEDLKLKVPTYEGKPIFSSKSLSEPGREFLDKYNDWQEIPELENNGPWWAVPPWSLPAWKAAGVLATEGSGLPAACLAQEMLKNPDRLLTPESTEILLNRFAEKYPHTVAEARAVRGSRLPRDFQAIVKEEYGLTRLPILLEVLANYPKASSNEIAQKAIAYLYSPQVSLPLDLTGQHPAALPAAQSGAGKPQPMHPADQEASQWLPSVRFPEIRVYMGKKLEAAWIGEEEEKYIRPEPRECVENLGDGLMRRFGIDLPTVRFYEGDSGMKIPENGFRIEVLNDTGHPFAEPVSVKQENPLDRLSTALSRRAEYYRVKFLTPEIVNYYIGESGVRKWLQRHYSITDLKLLLQAVINPSPEEISEREEALQKGNEGKTFKVPPANSVRQPAWLLRSLVFWSLIHDKKSLPAMAGALRETQRVRLQKESPAAQNLEVSSMTQKGVEALIQGRVDEAEKNFVQAIKLDQAAAVSSFQVFYPQECKQSLIRKLADFRDGYPPYATRAERIELEDLSAEKGFDQRVGPQNARRLRLCLLKAYAASHGQARRKLITDLVQHYGTPDQWPTPEALWFGTELLKHYNPLKDDPTTPDKAMVFLQSALPKLKQDEAKKHFQELLQSIPILGPNQWFVKRLPALAEIRKDPEISLDIAYYLSGRETAVDMDQVVSLATQAKQELPGADISEDRRKGLSDNADYLRTVTLLRKKECGADVDLREAEETLLGLSTSPAFSELAYYRLATLRVMENRSKEALEIIDQELQKCHDPLPDGIELAKRLDAGDKKGISQVGLKALGKIRKDNQGKVTRETQGFAFLAALALFAADTEGGERVAREFLRTNNENVPYIAEMLKYHPADKDKDSKLRLSWAASILGKVIPEWQNINWPYDLKLKINLMAGKKAAITQMGLEARHKIKKDDQGKVTKETEPFAFIAATALLLTDTGGGKQVAREFLKTKNQNVLYVAMILYSHMADKDKAEALKVLNRRWARIDPASWPARLGERDQTVWQEMLIGYALHKVSPNDIFPALEPDRFADSKLSQVPMERNAMLCEAYFYDALLAKAEGKPDQMESSLNRSVGTNFRLYIEYYMAKFLLEQSRQK